MELKDWSKSKCCNKHCEPIDLITILIAGYDAKYKDSWSYCLSQKWSLGDCVSGCHNEVYDLMGKHHQNRHSHQKRLSRVSVSKAADELEKANADSEAESCNAVNDEDYNKKEWFKDFDSLYDDLTKVLNDVDGIDKLTIYDAALRIGWNQEPQLLPEKYVYLHSGAMKGALALQKLTELTGKGYFRYDGKPGNRVEISHFREDLQGMKANHLEDFLCIFHKILRYWAEGLENDQKKEEEKKKRGIRKK